MQKYPSSCFAAVIAVTLAFASPASALSSRTFVSRTGDDDNVCSAASPCGSFAGAIAKTADRGEIDCLDTGDFGSVAIQKPVTIDCSGSVGGIETIANGGTIINFDAFDQGNDPHVTLKHLSIIGNQ